MTTPPNKSTGDDVSDQACEVPLLELMASVPPKLIAKWTDIDGLQASHNVPVGKYLHGAIGVIRELQGFLQAAEAENKEYRSEVDALKSQVDALRKQAHDWSEIADEQQLRIQAAEARCERFEKAIQTIVDLGDCDDSAGKMYWVARHAQYVEAKAIAEQALAENKETK